MQQLTPETRPDLTPRTAPESTQSTSKSPGRAPESTHAKLKAGLVGAGYICEYHVAALRRAGIEIVGVTDIDADRAAAAAKQFNIPAAPNLKALAAAGANVIHVLTPPHTHAAVALEAIALGCNVLVEKPLAVEVDDCKRIDEAAKAAGVSVCVNHSLLFDPQVKRAIDTARGGKLGKIVSIDVLRGSVYPPYGGGALPPQYRSAGYPFRDLGVHALYLFEAFLGPIENVRADWQSLGGDANLAFDEWRAQVRCARGMGQFQLSWNVKPIQSQIIIQGTRGVLRADLFLMFQAMRSSTPLPKAAERVINAMTDSLKPMIDVPRGVWGFLRKKVLPYHGLQDLVAAFYASLAAGEPAPVTVADAARVVRWTEDVARAADADYARQIAPLTLSDRVDALVTGASGGVGGAIVDRLVADGKRVRIFVRRPPATVRPGVEVALGNLGDPDAVDRAVRGARVVIHAGAAMAGGWIEHEGATVVGTKNVLESCARHGVEKLVHISSMSVIDWAEGDRGDRPVDEYSPLEPRAEDRGNYTRAKLAAEQLVSEFAAKRKAGRQASRGSDSDGPAPSGQAGADLATIILRPGQIFGGKIPLMTAAVARKAGGRLLILGDGKVRLPLVTLEDVVDAIMLAAESELGDGQVIQLVDLWTPTQNELIAEVLGQDAKVIRIPRPVVFTLGWFSEVALGLLKRKSPLSRYRLKSALSRRTFRSVNATLLNWRPTLGAREAVKRIKTKTATERPSGQTTTRTAGEGDSAQASASTGRPTGQLSMQGSTPVPTEASTQASTQVSDGATSEQAVSVRS